MSYCHLTNVGINFNNGFGEWVLPKMQNAINNASCLTSCDTVECTDYYADNDGDGYGNPSSLQTICGDENVPANVVEDNTDCNDNDNSQYPGAVCNSSGCEGTLSASCSCQASGTL